MRIASSIPVTSSAIRRRLSFELRCELAEEVVVVGGAIGLEVGDVVPVVAREKDPDTGLVVGLPEKVGLFDVWLPLDATVAAAGRAVEG